MRTDCQTSIILPTYNEIDNIGPLIKQIMDQLKGDRFEVLVVDDNSPDGTSDYIKSEMKNYENLRLITRTTDKGLIPSIREGIQKANGEICIWMDADLSMSPSLIKIFIEKIEKGADLVVGSRYVQGGGVKGANLNGDKTTLYRVWKNLKRSEDSFFSAMLSYCGNAGLRFILHPSVHDYTSGFFGGKKSTFEKVPIEGEFVDYCISLSYRALMRGLNVVEVPMILDTRKYGESKTSNSFFSILSIAYMCYKKAFVLKFQVKNERSSKNECAL